MENPYLDVFKTLPPWGFEAYKSRRNVVPMYAWAIPNDEAIKAIVDCGPILEIGAGNGYWASLIAQMGGDIIATDPGSKQFEFTKEWHPPFRLDAVSAVEKYGAGRALLSVWPGYSQHWCYQALTAYTGDTFIYVGEGPWGCTGDDALHVLREDETKWKEIKSIHIPQWDGIHDELIVYRRVA
jgi:hypothetical protein